MLDKTDESQSRRGPLEKGAKSFNAPWQHAYLVKNYSDEICMSVWI
jgi:hypothetical protein